MKKIKVINKNEKEFVHEFNIHQYKKKDNIIYDLYYSDSSVWTSTTRNQLIVSVKDNGNGLDFKFSEKIKLDKIEYHEATYMYIILKYIQKDQNYNKFKFIK